MNEPKQSVSSEEMITGDIVHHALQLHSDNKNNALTFVSRECAKNKLSTKSYTHANLCIYNFFNGINKLVTEQDLIEHEFSFELHDDILLRGKIDRIVFNKGYPALIDWKTGGEFATKESLANNVQFIIYEYAMKHLYETPFSLLHISLSKNKIIAVEINKYARENLFENVIPTMLFDIRQNKLFKTGIYTNECNHCSYIDTCIKSRSKNVVESPSFITE